MNQIREYSLTKIYGKDFMGYKHVDTYSDVTVTNYRWNKKDYAMAGLAYSLIREDNFDGFGVIRYRLDKNIRKSTNAFLFPNLEEVIRKWLGTVKENTKEKVKYTVHFPVSKRHAI